ncbi:MAG TPA: presqualene diphosphate synthase HpnD [Vicinamibacterales bacterium]|nr:presqualene diphosphate synthase HpnD [Vicinamibacterales bacterium]
MARDTNFYYSFLVLPARKRDAIVAVWDFCRAVDDAVDEAATEEEAASQVAEWRAELERCFDGARPSTRQGAALQPWIREFHLPRSAFDALIEGVEMDLRMRRYETFADLYEYCIRVASAVGLMCVEIFGYRNPATRQYAVDLGVALQLTNILRDIPSDLARGRLYVPLEDLARHGCTEDDLRREAEHHGHGVRSSEVKRLLAFEAQRARDYYARAEAVLPSEDARRMVAARIMAAIYRAILVRIEAADYDVFSSVIRIPRPRRAAIAASTWARAIARL